VTAVRWGVIGTAGIARKNFLPAVREAGGEAAVVAGRDAERTSRWARDNAVGRAVVGYQRLIDDPGVDALYIPLPNALHAEWTIRALRAGKPVLCEKPLTASPAGTEQVLAVARETGTPLWEAFVFPFHDQMRRLRELIAGGVIGDLREIQSNFHFFMTHRGTNIRMSAELAGGALLDVGCYPVRLARYLFAAEHTSAWAAADYDPGGVDLSTWGCLGFPGGRRLLLSCGFNRAQDTFSRLLGTGRSTSPIRSIPPRMTGSRSAWRAASQLSTRVPGLTGSRSPRRSGISRPWSGGRRSPACWRSTPRSAPPGLWTTWPAARPPRRVFPLPDPPAP
jgi:predicted dehydrogenase